MTSTSEISFWEQDSFFRQTDLIVIGSGIVGLNAAISYKKKFPRARVLVLERGWLPLGASTKNAGFACFGSPTELLEDFSIMNEELVLDTVHMRLMGLKRLRKLLGDRKIDFHRCGGYEVFDDMDSFSACSDRLHWLNQQLKSVTGKSQTFLHRSKKINSFGLKGFAEMIESPLEGQLDTGKMMRNLLLLAQSLDVFVVNNSLVTRIEQLSRGVMVALENGWEIISASLIVATNGFARNLLPQLPVTPARTQVLITSVIPQLKLKGVFHYQQGYFYFRNVGGRVLLGGGRHLDFKKEETQQFGTTAFIQEKLEQLLKKNIIPGKKFEIEQRWSGIMGLGSEKKPIIRRVSKNVVAAVRMGGMGVAIGSLVGELAVNELIS